MKDGNVELNVASYPQVSSVSRNAHGNVPSQNGQMKSYSTENSLQMTQNTEFGDEPSRGKKRKLKCPEQPVPSKGERATVHRIVTEDTFKTYQVCCYPSSFENQEERTWRRCFSTKESSKRKCARCQHYACHEHLWHCQPEGIFTDLVCRHCLTGAEALRQLRTRDLAQAMQEEELPDLEEPTEDDAWRFI